MGIKNSKDLTQRWVEVEKIDTVSSPFGLLKDGFQDFRGLPSLGRGKITGRKFVQCDLSGSNFSGHWIEQSTFSNCRFTSVNFDNIAEHRNTFHSCSFVACSFQRARLGYFNSHYEDCLFEKCNFKQGGGINAVFKRVEFVNNKFNGIDFGASGFWNCKFIGEINDVWFRGGFAFPSEQIKFGVPKETGLHHIDFGQAEINCITISDGCVLEYIKLPLDGETFICDCDTLFEKLDKMVRTHFTPEEWENVLQYLHGTKVHSNRQRLMLKTRSDMIEACSHSTGSKLFEILKSNFEHIV